MMIVQKFGGTSVGNADRIKNVASLAGGEEEKIVVLSAFSGTTNELTQIVQHLYRNEKAAVSEIVGRLRAHYLEIIDDLYSSQETKDKAKEICEAHWTHIQSFTLDMFTRFEERTVLAQGELLSTVLFKLYCDDSNIPAVLLPALDFMRIDQQGEPDEWYIKSSLQKLVEANKGTKLFITQGFICRNHFGDIDNLKRGGSDYSASIIGAALGAEQVQIWTDIDGMHNNDPRVVKTTKPIERLTFDKAAELAYFGAKILHPTSVQPARKAGIPVVLKNTLFPEKKGTIISNEPSGDFIKAVAAKDDIRAIKIKSGRMLLAYGFLRKVFEVFERHKISIDMITTSEVAVSLTVDTHADLTKLVNELEEYGTVEIDENQTIVCIVGHLLQEDPGHAEEIFGCLSEIPIRMISYGGSRNNISLLIDSHRKEEALKALNEGLFNMSENG